MLYSLIPTSDQHLYIWPSGSITKEFEQSAQQLFITRLGYLIFSKKVFNLFEN